MEDAVRDADFEEARKVAAILSNSSAFRHQCRECFKRRDSNGDGALPWGEVECVILALYRSFGLRDPCVPSLRSFFEVADGVGGRVFSEKEFRRYFEGFLRHSYFDEHLQRAKARRSSLRGQGAGHSRRRQISPHEASPGTCIAASPMLQNVAGHDVTYRHGPELMHRPTEESVPPGGKVRVQEHWVLTSEGWLPLVDQDGNALFEILAPRDEGVPTDGASPTRARRAASPRASSMRHCQSEPSLATHSGPFAATPSSASRCLVERARAGTQIEGRLAPPSFRGDRPSRLACPAASPANLRQKLLSPDPGGRHSTGGKTPASRKHRPSPHGPCAVGLNVGTPSGEAAWGDGEPRRRERFTMLA